MAALVHFDAQGQWGETLICEQRVGETLRRHGLDYGHWPLHELGDASLDAVLAAYAQELAGLRGRLQIRSLDRVQLEPEHAGWPALRETFVAEHTHADAEVRCFLGGTGLIYIRVADGHLALLCEAGDWVAQPTGAGAPALPRLDAFVEQLLALTGHAEDFCAQDARDEQVADASFLIALDVRQKRANG